MAIENSRPPTMNQLKELRFHTLADEKFEGRRLNDLDLMALRWAQSEIKRLRDWGNLLQTRIDLLGE